MRKTRLFVLLLAGGVILGGCSDTGAPESDQEATSGAASTPTMPQVPAPASVLPQESSDTGIQLQYPDLHDDEHGLGRKLRQIGDKARRQFKQQVRNNAADHWHLRVVFSVTSRTSRFVSVREQGVADAGGMQPKLFDAGIVYDTDRGKILSLDDLFTDAATARQRFSSQARDELEDRLLAEVPGGARTSPDQRKQWAARMRDRIEAGTDPDGDNFSRFLVRANGAGKATGLRLIFPTYQVAPYTYGSQTVDIAASVFGDILADDYRSAFVEAGDAD